MTKIARPSTHLPPSAREGSPQVPLRSRTKPQPTAEAPESLSLTSPGGRGTRASSTKEEPPAGRETSREGRVPLSLPAVRPAPGSLGASILPFQVAGSGHCTCPPHPRSCAARSPPPARPCPAEPALGAWSSRHPGTLAQVQSRTRACPQRGARDRSPTWGHTRAQPGSGRYSHSLSLSLSVTHTHTHTQVRTDALQGAQGHASQDSAAQVSQTHTRTLRRTAQSAEQQTHSGTRR